MIRRRNPLALALTIVVALLLSIVAAPNIASALTIYGCGGWAAGDPPCLWANAETGLGTGQNYGVLIGDQILADGIGFDTGEPIDLYWDDAFIGSYVPGVNGSFTTFVSTSNWGYTVPSFSDVDGPCSSYVRAVQDGVQIA